MKNKEIDSSIQNENEEGVQNWIEKQARKLKKTNIIFSVVIFSWGSLVVYVSYLKFLDHQALDFRSIIDVTLIVIVGLYVASMHKMRKSTLEAYDTTTKLLNSWSGTLVLASTKNDLIKKQLELMDEKDDIIKEQAELINILNAKVLSDGNEKRGDSEADSATSEE
jgi:hypothetical protein